MRIARQHQDDGLKAPTLKRLETFEHLTDKMLEAYLRLSAISFTLESHVIHSGVRPKDPHDVSGSYANLLRDIPPPKDED